MNLILPTPPADLETAYFNPGYLRLSNLNWLNLGFIVAMHAGAVAAPFFFSWSGLAWMVGLYCFTGCLGITRLVSKAAYFISMIFTSANIE